MGAKRIRAKVKQEISNLLSNKSTKNRQMVKKNRNKVSDGMSVLTRMIANPCDAELVPGVYETSNGILSRYKSVHALAESDTNGFVLWCPSYPGNDYDAASVRSLNAFFFAAASVANSVQNTDVNPLGSNTGLSTSAHAVGADGFINGTTLRDYRTVSACIRMNYTGTTSDCQGRMGFLDNVPVSIFSNANVNVSTLMQYASNTQRVSLDTMEVIFRPDEVSEKFKNKDAKLWTTQVADATFLDQTAAADEPVMIGFVWTGVATNQLVFDFIQNIEWRPDTGTGYVEPAIKQVAPVAQYPRILNWLDNNIPGWTTAARELGSRAASLAVNYVLGGPPQRLVTPPSNRLRIGY